MMAIGLPQCLQTSAGLLAFITVGKKTFNNNCIRRNVILALPCKTGLTGHPRLNRGLTERLNREA